MTCPVCDRKLSGSIAQGSSKKYPYYHCYDRCRTRINAILLNDCYQNKLQQLILSNNTIDLFKCILQDQDIKTLKASYLYNQNLIERKIKEEGQVLSRGRKLFLAGVLKIDDYNELKKENQVNIRHLKKEARDIFLKLKAIDKKDQIEDKEIVEVFRKFSEFDTSDKKSLVSLIPPVDIDYKTGDLSLDLNQAFLKILSKKSNRKTNKKNEFY